jgi:2-methoxy-6-polyprenyl-1,4-benzoquinol methylase
MVMQDELIHMIGLPPSARAHPDYIPRHLDVAGGTGDIAFRSFQEMEKVYAPQLNAVIAKANEASSSSLDKDR